MMGLRTRETCKCRIYEENNGIKIVVLKRNRKNVLVRVNIGNGTKSFTKSNFSGKSTKILFLFYSASNSTISLLTKEMVILNIY